MDVCSPHAHTHQTSTGPTIRAILQAISPARRSIIHPPAVCCAAMYHMGLGTSCTPRNLKSKDTYS